MSRPIQESGRRLSAGAEAALEEYLDREREQLVREAVASRGSGQVTAEDIVIAYTRRRAIESGNSDGVRAVARAAFTTSARSSSRLLLINGVVVVLASILALLISLTLQQSDASTSTMVWLTVAVVAVVGASLGALIATLQSSRERLRLAQVAQDEVKSASDAARSAHKESQSAYERILNATRYASSPDSMDRAGFLVVWSEFESELRQLGYTALGIPERDASRYPVGELLRKLAKSGVIDESFYARVRTTLEARNRLVHLQNVPSHQIEAATIEAAALRDEVSALARKPPGPAAVIDDEGFPPLSGADPRR